MAPQRSTRRQHTMAPQRSTRRQHAMAPQRSTQDNPLLLLLRRRRYCVPRPHWRTCAFCQTRMIRSPRMESLHSDTLAPVSPPRWTALHDCQQPGTPQRRQRASSRGSCLSLLITGRVRSSNGQPPFKVMHTLSALWELRVRHHSCLRRTDIRTHVVVLREAEKDQEAARARAAVTEVMQHADGAYQARLSHHMLLDPSTPYRVNWRVSQASSCLLLLFHAMINLAPIWSKLPYHSTCGRSICSICSMFCEPSLCGRRDT